MMDENMRNEHHDHHHGMEKETKPTAPEQEAPKEGMDQPIEEDFTPKHTSHAEQHTPMDHASQMQQKSQINHTGHETQQVDTEHAGHEAHADHTGHEQMFRQRFWLSLLLSIPVLIFSPAVQDLLGYSLPEFTGIQWIAPFFAVIVFFYGGIPFLKMAVPELQNRQPGMMTLISLAISVAFIIQPGSFIPAQQHDLLLGAGHINRHHAAWSLD